MGSLLDPPNSTPSLGSVSFRRYLFALTVAVIFGISVYSYSLIQGPRESVSFNDGNIANDITSEPYGNWNETLPPMNSIEPDPIPSLPDTKDYTDVFYSWRKLFYGPWTANIPSTVIAGQEFSMQFICKTPDDKLCPTYYILMFHGPTRLTVNPEAFGPLNWTWASPNEYAVLTVTWTIPDPGKYRVYAYPELPYCSQWNYLVYTWIRATVDGTPFDLTVLPNGDAVEEGYASCTNKQIYNGRYLSVDPSLSSTEFAAMYNSTGRAFVWAPYDCKIPALTLPEVVSSLPSAKHIVFLGDSVMRSGFCHTIWEPIRGVRDGACNSTPDEYHFSHKFTNLVVEEGGISRSVNFTLLWTRWIEDLYNNLDIMLSLEPPPTHIVLSFALWISNRDVDVLKEQHWKALHFLKEHFSHSIKHIAIKSPSSIVQAVDCRGKDWKGSDNIPVDSLDFRYGGAIKHKAVFEVAKVWNKLHDEAGDHSTFRVSAIDAWTLTDNRLETNSDGRHFSLEFEYDKHRPFIGEADECIQDLIFDEFITGRYTD